MMQNRIVTENQLDEWVRGNSRAAQGLIVELIWRLIAASSPRPNERRFPLGDSIGQPGPDGVLDTDFPFDPFVPVGRSFWEIGTGIELDPKRHLTTENTMQHRTSGRSFHLCDAVVWQKGLAAHWKEGTSQWLGSTQQMMAECAIDGSGLIDWLHHFPAVERWLAPRCASRSSTCKRPVNVGLN